MDDIQTLRFVKTRKLRGFSLEYGGFQVKTAVIFTAVMNLTGTIPAKAEPVQTP